MHYRDFVGQIAQKPAIVAHRGGWHQAPENSLAAIEVAIAAGYESVEVNIQKSEDGVFFLMHDDMLTRMTGTEFPSSDLAIAQLQVMPLKNGAGGQGAGFSHHAIPTLAEALKLAKGKIFLDLDVKHDADLTKVAKLVDDMDMQDEVTIKMAIQSEADLAYLTALEEEYGLMVMPQTHFSKRNCAEMIALLKGADCSLVEASFDSLYSLVSHREAFDAAGLALRVRCLDAVACCGFSDQAALKDPDAIWGSLVEAGVAVIQTDEPEALASWRQAQALPATAHLATSVPHTSL